MTDYFFVCRLLIRRHPQELTEGPLLVDLIKGHVMHLPFPFAIAPYRSASQCHTFSLVADFVVKIDPRDYGHRRHEPPRPQRRVEREPDTYYIIPPGMTRYFGCKIMLMLGIYRHQCHFSR